MLEAQENSGIYNTNYPFTQPHQICKEWYDRPNSSYSSCIQLLLGVKVQRVRLLVPHIVLEPHRPPSKSPRRAKSLRQDNLGASSGKYRLDDGTRYYFRLEDTVFEIRIGVKRLSKRGSYPIWMHDTSFSSTPFLGLIGRDLRGFDVRRFIPRLQL